MENKNYFTDCWLGQKILRLKLEDWPIREGIQSGLPLESSPSNRGQLNSVYVGFLGTKQSDQIWKTSQKIRSHWYTGTKRQSNTPATVSPSNWLVSVSKKHILVRPTLWSEFFIATYNTHMFKIASPNLPSIHRPGTRTNNEPMGCRHSTVDSSAPSILPPGFESQAYHLSFYKFIIVSCGKRQK